MASSSSNQAQILLPAPDLTQEIEFFQGLGFALDQIFPADNPNVAILSGHNTQLRLERDRELSPSIIHILTDHPESVGDGVSEFHSPGGTTLLVLPKTYELEIPATKHKFEIRHLANNDSWVIGRAGMMYRDLIPDRLGGSIIASHINIPNGGPVPDMVHYHTIGFQLIFCYKGWVKLVYEDQGPPFILNAGDCVTQPPEIRHRVLEASDNLEVIEIGVPSDHMTTIDHEMELPNADYRPDRKFQGQTFCHHTEEDANWHEWMLPGFEVRETGINSATKNMADVQVIKSKQVNGLSEFALIHNADIYFAFIIQGSAILSAEGSLDERLRTKDAFVIPPNYPFELKECSEDFELLQVTLPGNFSLNPVS